MDICRNSTCKKKVNVTERGMNYYCIEHLRCGTPTNGNPCQGCLDTIQGKSKKNKSWYCESLHENEDNYDTEVTISINI